MHPAIANFKRTGVQLSPIKLKSSYSFSPSCTSCRLENCFQTSITTYTVRLHLKRSSQHLISRTAPSHSALSECPPVYFSPSPFQPFLSSFSSPSFKHPTASRAKDFSPLTKNSLLPRSLTASYLALPSFVPSSPHPAHKKAGLAAVPALLYREKISRLLSFAVSHIPVFSMLQLSPSPALWTPLHTRTQIFLPAFLALCTTLSAYSSSAPLLQPVFQQIPDLHSRLVSFHQEWTDLSR